jgi:endogenous inhibitor of DNA gyrase (YacG/DUF329 family)
MSQPLTVDCPTCGAPVEWKATNPNRPFCSDRCKLIDLGAWASAEPRTPKTNYFPKTCHPATKGA